MCSVRANGCRRHIYTWVENPSNKDFGTLMPYVMTQWIGEDAPFPPQTWSGYRVTHRTNNSLEGWHNHINLLSAHKRKPYALITLLGRLAELLEMWCISEKVTLPNVRIIRARSSEAWDAHANQPTYTDYNLLAARSNIYRCYMYIG